MRLSKVEYALRDVMFFYGDHWCTWFKGFFPLEDFTPDLSKRFGLSTRCRLGGMKYNLEHKEERAVYNLEGYLGKLWSNISQHTVNGKFAETGRKNPRHDSYFRMDIRIWPPWQDNEEAFIAWIREKLGERSKDEDGDWLTLDRIDNEGNYEPGNLRWADWIVQASNKGRGEVMAEAGYVEGYYDGKKSD